ncbi:Uncharacterised protein [Chlamydia trachomatis]|nr:Uncharacterised protein [Chlamydia trachomatis]
MLYRLDFLCQRLGSIEVNQRLLIVAHGEIHVGQSRERVESVPFIFRLAHQLIGSFIFSYGIFIAMCLLVECPKVVVTKRHTQVIACLLVMCHRLAIIGPCRVDLPAMFKN